MLLSLLSRCIIVVPIVFVINPFQTCVIYVCMYCRMKKGFYKRKHIKSSRLYWRYYDVLIFSGLLENSGTWEVSYITYWYQPAYIFRNVATSFQIIWRNYLSWWLRHYLFATLQLNVIDSIACIHWLSTYQRSVMGFIAS